MTRRNGTLTELELGVLKVLWDNEESLTISEIASQMTTLGNATSVASVAQVMKKLLERTAVKVDEHRLVSNVYARTFLPVMTREDYMGEEIRRLQNTLSVNKRVSTMGLFQTLLQNSGDGLLNEKDVDELELFLKHYRQECGKEEV